MSCALAVVLALLLVLVVYMAKTSGRRHGGCPDEPCAKGATCYRTNGGRAVCVQCGVPTDCPVGGPSACVNNRCGCTHNGDCPAGTRCEKGTCVARRFGGACSDHADCGPLGACANGKCVPNARGLAGELPPPVG